MEREALLKQDMESEHNPVEILDESHLYQDTAKVSEMPSNGVAASYHPENEPWASDTFSYNPESEVVKTLGGSNSADAVHTKQDMYEMCRGRLGEDYGSTMRNLPGMSAEELRGIRQDFRDEAGLWSNVDSDYRQNSDRYGQSVQQFLDSSDAFREKYPVSEQQSTEEGEAPAPTSNGFERNNVPSGNDRSSDESTVTAHGENAERTPDGEALSSGEASAPQQEDAPEQAQSGFDRTNVTSGNDRSPEQGNELAHGENAEKVPAGEGQASGEASAPRQENAPEQAQSGFDRNNVPSGNDRSPDQSNEPAHRENAERTPDREERPSGEASAPRQENGPEQAQSGPDSNNTKNENDHSSEQDSKPAQRENEDAERPSNDNKQSSNEA